LLYGCCYNCFGLKIANNAISGARHRLLTTATANTMPSSSSIIVFCFRRYRVAERYTQQWVIYKQLIRRHQLHRLTWSSKLTIVVFEMISTYR
jgi:hypothetical protein